MENDFNPFNVFYDRNYPIVFSLFQLKEIYRCLFVYRLTLSLTFPYSSLYSSMRFLYGDDCMVSFIVY